MRPPFIGIEMQIHPEACGDGPLVDHSYTNNGKERVWFFYYEREWRMPEDDTLAAGETEWLTMAGSVPANFIDWWHEPFENDRRIAGGWAVWRAVEHFIQEMEL